MDFTDCPTTGMPLTLAPYCPVGAGPKAAIPVDPEVPPPDNAGTAAAVDAMASSFKSFQNDKFIGLITLLSFSITI